MTDLERRFDVLDEALKRKGVALDDTGAMGLDDLELEQLAKDVVRDTMLKLGVYTVEGLSDKTRGLLVGHIKTALHGVPVVHGTVGTEEFWELPNHSVLKLRSMPES